ncbi:MAG: HAMP domain-containing protein [Betaproteobacteria bacterium]|nr:HAMP domain-containing protein [Betaproteobacteria bacterium]
MTMSLRLQINLIIGLLLASFALVLIGLQIQDTRRSVRDEMEGASMVATQLLSRVQANISSESVADMTRFLKSVGRIRANEIELQDEHGQVLYHSPPPVYKAGRDAPGWYSAMVTPSVITREIQLQEGRLLVWADPSRAVLDGWDDFVPILATVLIGFILGNLLVFLLVGRVLQPIQQVVQGLQHISAGSYATRLPKMSGQEAQQMGSAFNAMAQSVQDGIEARAKAQEATQALALNRELTQVIQARIEEVRGQIARELHDELGQQVTAIKSVGLAIAHRAKDLDSQIESSAHMVVSCADTIYQEVHQLVSKLRPLALDRFGLADALQDMLEDARSRHPEMSIQLELAAGLDTLSEALATAIYRIMQESLTNALRHAQASQISMKVEMVGDSVSLAVQDNGKGPAADWAESGHFGVIGMRERAHGLGGQLQFEALEPAGVRVHAVLPLSQNTHHV